MCVCVFVCFVLWRKLDGEESHKQHRSANVGRVDTSRRIRWVEHVIRMEDGRSALKIFATKRRSIERSSGRWENNIAIHLKKND